MSNIELTKFYMSLPLSQKLMPEVVYSNIIPALDLHFNSKWTWELADERFYADNTMVCTTVTLYIPGKVCTGRALCKIKDYGSNHLFAILDACRSFMSTGSNTSTTQVNSNPGGQQMTPDQIMAALNQAPEQTVNTAAQFYNHKDEHGISANGVPFNAITENCQQELQQEMGIGNTASTQSQQNSSDYDAPQERLKGFSQHQIDRLNKFKKDFDILNDNMFDNYVNTWDKSLTSKKDIIPANVESFLAWAENLGKMDC